MSDYAFLIALLGVLMLLGAWRGWNSGGCHSVAGLTQQVIEYRPVKPVKLKE